MSRRGQITSGKRFLENVSIRSSAQVPFMRPSAKDWTSYRMKPPTLASGRVIIVCAASHLAAVLRDKGAPCSEIVTSRAPMQSNNGTGQAGLRRRLPGERIDDSRSPCALCAGSARPASAARPRATCQRDARRRTASSMRSSVVGDLARCVAARDHMIIVSGADHCERGERGLRSRRGRRGLTLVLRARQARAPRGQGCEDALTLFL